MQHLIFMQAAIVRGYLLNQASFVEKMMEYYTAYHFCKDKDRAQEMIDFLIGDKFVSFESKRAAFENIIKKHDSKLYKENKDKFENLTTMQTQRNRMAHLVVLMSEEAVQRFKKDGAFGLVKYGVETKPIWYDKTETKRIMDAADSVADWVKTLV